MNDKPEYDAGEGDSSSRIVLSGRVKKRQEDVIQIELVDGMTIDVPTDDCTVVEETTDPVTVRPTVTVELHGKKPITATFQPHLFRVLAAARTVPFVFSGIRDAAGDSVLAIAYLGRAAGGGGGTDHDTRMMSRTWIGTTQEDGTKSDGPLEPDEIILN